MVVVDRQFVLSFFFLARVMHAPFLLRMEW